MYTDVHRCINNSDLDVNYGTIRERDNCVMLLEYQKHFFTTTATTIHEIFKRVDYDKIRSFRQYCKYW